MADISIDWNTYVIFIPKAYTNMVETSPGIFELDVDAFRLDLKSIEDDVEGIPHTDTHNHRPPVTVAGTPLARVVEILAPYTITFEDGQYRVILKGANNNILDVANLNQVSIAPTNSAGLADLGSLQAASFGGRVALDITSPYAGTVFPIGTRGFPVNNTADAISISEERGLRDVVVLSDMTMTSGDWSDGYTFLGDSPVVLTLTLDPGTNVTNCTFMDMTVQGTLDGDNVIRQCVVNDISYFNGQIFESAINGTITLAGGVQASMYDCWSNVPGAGVGMHADINMGGSGNSLVLRNYSGGVGINNIDTGASDPSSIDMNSGRIVFGADVLGGVITVRGVADVEDNSGGTAVIIDNTVNVDVHEILAILKNKTVTDPVTGIMTLYADDGVTPLLSAQLYEDAAETQTYRGQGAEVRERLT